MGRKSQQIPHITIRYTLLQYVLSANKELSPCVIASDLDLKYNTIKKYCRELAKEGKLRRRACGKVTFYSNPKMPLPQLSIISSNEGHTPSPPDLLKRVHKLRFRSVLRDIPEYFIHRLQQGPWAEVPLKNNEYYQTKKPFEDFIALIRVTTKHVIVMLPAIESMDIEEAITESYKRAESVFSWFENKYKVQLGEIQCRFLQTSQHVAVVDHPLAQIAASKKWFYFDGRVSFDASKGPGEIDLVNVRYSEEDALAVCKDFSEMVQRGIRITGLSDNQEQFLDFMERQNEINLHFAFKMFNKINGDPKQEKEKDNSEVMFS